MAKNTKTNETPVTDGPTTRDDATDLGVPMKTADASTTEPSGPEDAFATDTRGDYSGRVGPTDYQPHQVVPNPDAQDGEPQVKVIAQRDNA